MKIILNLRSLSVVSNKFDQDASTRLLDKVERKIKKVSSDLQALVVLQKEKATQKRADEIYVLRELLRTQRASRAKLKRELSNQAPSTNKIPTGDVATFPYKTQKGPEVFNEINGTSKRMQYTEGYWRVAYNKGKRGLPFPVVMAVTGYNKSEFLAKLKALEKNSKKQDNKGTSPNRWTGSSNGSGEYTNGKWRWPSGYKTYIRAGVPPSAAFYKFVTGRSLKSLPTYGRP